MIQHLKTAQFHDEVESAKGLVLVDFYADWCMPCKMLAPVMEQLAQENDTVKFFKVNVDEEPQLAAKFGVMSIPTVIFVKDGGRADKTVGALSKGSFQSKIDSMK